MDWEKQFSCGPFDHTPVEGGIGAGAREEAAMQWLLGQ